MENNVKKDRKKIDFVILIILILLVALMSIFTVSRQSSN